RHVRTRRHIFATTPRSPPARSPPSLHDALPISLNRDGSDVPRHLAMGTFVVITSDSAYARQCMREYNCLVDATGDYASLNDDKGDRKSTRLNSSHVKISYAVFCLKKKKASTCRP